MTKAGYLLDWKTDRCITAIGYLKRKVLISITFLEKRIQIIDCASVVIGLPDALTGNRT